MESEAGRGESSGFFNREFAGLTDYLHITPFFRLIIIS